MNTNGNKNYRSIGRAIKRGHVAGGFNNLTGWIDIFRRTTNSKKHTVFVTSFNPNQG